MASEDARWLLRRAAQPQDGRIWWWAFIGFVVVLALWNSRDATPDEQGLSPSAATGQWRTFAGVTATVTDITTDPGTFGGMVVSVGGEVNRVLDRRAFTLGGGTFGGTELLVVSARPLPDVPDRPAGAPLAPGDVLLVTGPVRPFNQAVFQRDANALLARARFAPWDGKLAILAQDIRISPRLQPPTPPAAAPGGPLGVPPGVGFPGVPPAATGAAPSRPGTDGPPAAATPAAGAKPPAGQGAGPAGGGEAPAPPTAGAPGSTPAPAPDSTPGVGAGPVPGYIPVPAPVPPVAGPTDPAPTPPVGSPQAGSPAPAAPPPGGRPGPPPRARPVPAHRG